MSSSESNTVVSESPGAKKKSLKKKKKDDEVPSDLSQVPEEIPNTDDLTNSQNVLDNSTEDTVTSDSVNQPLSDDVQPSVENIQPDVENVLPPAKNLDNVLVDSCDVKKIDDPVDKIDEMQKQDPEPPINIESERVMTMDQFNERKSFFEKYIQELQDRLSHEEDAAANLNQNKRKLEGDVQNLKKDLENLELALQKVSRW